MTKREYWTGLGVALMIPFGGDHRHVPANASIMHGQVIVPKSQYRPRKKKKTFHKPEGFVGFFVGGASSAPGGNSIFPNT